MKDGFIRVAAASVDVKVADPEFNRQKVMEAVLHAADRGAKVLVLPELVLSAYTCGDLFWQTPLLEETKKQFAILLEETRQIPVVLVVGMPLVLHQNLFNCAVFLYRGKILGVVPKKHLPNYSEFYEMRHFTPGKRKVEMISLLGQQVPFGMNLLFCCENVEDLVLAAEVCEDLWVPMPPSTFHGMAGATVICNPSASDETTTKDAYRKELVSSQSARLVGAYIYASAGEGESTQDLVYSGHNMIAEYGALLAESARFENHYIDAEIDVQRLAADRRKMSTFVTEETGEPYHRVYFTLEEEETKLERNFPRTPFIPADKKDRDKRCDEILTIQAMGLKKRLAHTGCRHAVVGISGGLDSTLAVLVTARAFDMLDIPRENILCVTMPCFGTTDRTYSNAVLLTKKLGATLREIRINQAVEQHFADIGHDSAVHDVTYENSQARERTQILMDLANKIGGMVIGTGDMSELALGWATYNGDHMSMYAVNASVPKTLVRHLVRYYADAAKSEELRAVLLDVLDTPVSPELLPPVDGVISQVTEDLVGPYELHDFFLYYMLRFGFRPTKIFRLAKLAFDGVYEDVIIYKWLRTFCWRFFAQHFKRTCLPDGPKVGSIAVSPRGDLRMPTDASPSVWMAEMDELKETLGLS
ncbi:MAG: NAD(+) synthase [Eubacteriales bacterium]|nr:NAD(+) synthase [Eubacteriales bacterium]